MCKISPSYFLFKINISEQSDPGKIQKAFSMSQALMIRKQTESDIFKEESDELAARVEDLERIGVYCTLPKQNNSCVYI